MLSALPIVGHDLRVHALTGNGVALAVRLALWAGIRVFVAAGNVMDHSLGGFRCGGGRASSAP